MARTIRTKVYQFNELSNEAKEKAIEKFRDGESYNWQDEVIETINAGLKHFDMFLNDYSIDWFNINGCSFDIGTNLSEEIENLSGVRLWKYLHNNKLLTYFNTYTKKRAILLDGDCPFTGVCFDENFLDNIRSFVNAPTNVTFMELLTESVQNTLKAGCEDYEYQLSDEGITETIEANEYEFTSDGRRF